MRSFPLADEYWLLSRDNYTGAPFVRGEVLGTGLVGALLGELLITGRIDIKQRLVVPLDRRAYGDWLTDDVLSRICQHDMAYPVRRWAEFLREEQYLREPGRKGAGGGVTIDEAIGRRLVRTGMVEEVTSRTFLGRTVVHQQPVNGTEAAAPLTRTRYLLEHPNELNLKQNGMHIQTVMLAGLGRATGLVPQIESGLSEYPLAEVIVELTMQLPDSAQELIAGIERATAAIALTIHR
jgi:hypothetical protein